MLLKNQILFGMKRKSKFFNFYFLLVLLQIVVSSCDNGEVIGREQNNSTNHQEHKELNSKYTPDSLIGKWKILYVDYLREDSVKYRKIADKSIFYRSRFLEEDSMVIEFDSDGTLKLNSAAIGVWSLKNDSISLSGELVRFNPFPFYLNTSYDVKIGNFRPNYCYISTMFYYGNGKRHHIVKYTMTRI
ncbi:MAG: hypothetical protein RLZ33_2611 [Bacteroidota bacterium]